MGMSDVRYGCGEGVCGTCTVLLDGDPVSACLLLAVQAADREITTLRGLGGECSRWSSPLAANHARSSAVRSVGSARRG